MSLLLTLTWLSFFLSFVSSQTCVTKNVGNLNWQSKNHQIYLNNERIALKGLSWFGFETVNYGLYGLNVHSQTWYLDWMVSHGFNAIRLPFSQQGVNSGSSYLAKMDSLISDAGDRGLLVMLDFHSIQAGAYTEGFPFSSQASVETTWVQLAQRYKSYWNVFMADLFNEPHDVNSGQWNTWISFCENVGNELIDNQGVNWLMAIQGTDSNCASISGCSSSQYCNWGENLRQLSCGASNQVDLTVPYRVVYTPHVYGPSIGGNAYGSTVWTERWGFIASDSSIDGAIMLGEYGTKTEFGWLGDLVDYLISIDQRNSYYWCLNPNSGDTGGLLKDDWTTDETTKLSYLSELQPVPTIFTVTSTEICWETNTPPPSEPIPSPTAKPVDTSLIKITNQINTQIYWIAFYIDNIGCGSITSVQVNDGNDYQGVSATYANGYWSVDNTGTAFSTPITLIITNSNSETITLTNVIENFSGGDVFYGNTNFCYSPTTTTTTTTTTRQPTPTTTTTTTTTTRQPTSTTTTRQPTPTTTTTTRQPTTSTTTTTRQPTASTTTTTSSPGSGISIKNHVDTQLWWLAFYIMDVDCGSVSGVQVMDGVNYPSWSVTCTNSNGYWSCNNNNGQFSLPISVRLTNTNGNIVTLTNIITNYNDNEIFTSNSQFCSGATTTTTTPQPTPTTTTTTTNQPVTTTTTTRNPTTTQPIPTTQPPNPSPTTGSSGNGITIQNYANANAYWYAFYISNLGCNAEIDTIQIRSSSSGSSWVTGSLNWNFYFFSQNTPYSVPLDIRITNTDGDRITKQNAITTFDQNTIFYLGQDFCSSSLNSRSSNSSNTNELSDGSTYGIIASCIVIAIIIGIGILFYIRNKNTKNNNNQTIVEMDNNVNKVEDPEGGLTTDTNNTPGNIQIDESD